MIAFSTIIQILRSYHFCGPRATRSYMIVKFQIIVEEHLSVTRPISEIATVLPISGNEGEHSSVSRNISNERKLKIKIFRHAVKITRYPIPR